MFAGTSTHEEEEKPKKNENVFEKMFVLCVRTLYSLVLLLFFSFFIIVLEFFFFRSSSFSLLTKKTSKMEETERKQNE